jgi:hypothetical protein
MIITTHRHLLPRLRTRGAIPLPLHGAGREMYSVDSEGYLWPYLTHMGLVHSFPDLLEMFRINSERPGRVIPVAKTFTRRLLDRPMHSYLVTADVFETCGKKLGGACAVLTHLSTCLFHPSVKTRVSGHSLVRIVGFETRLGVRESVSCECRVLSGRGL